MTTTKICDRMVRDLLQSDPKLRAMLTLKGSDELIKIHCITCTNKGFEENARAYVTLDPAEVVLCANKLPNLDSVAEALRHEAVHAYDISHNRYNLETCEGLASSEIRAAREGECKNSLSWLRNYCIKNHAEAATKNFFPNQYAQCVQKVYDDAVADKEPIFQRTVNK